jgi:hypothetical protein
MLHVSAIRQGNPRSTPNRRHRLAAFAASTVLVLACGSTPRAAVTSPAGAGTSETPLPNRSAEDVRAFLLPHEGESPAEANEPQGLEPLSDADLILAGKCQAVLTSRKDPLDFSKAVSKAMDAVSKRCLDLVLTVQTQNQARKRDATAQTQMRVLAKALASGVDCDSGAPNPAVEMGACFMGMNPLLWDRKGWSCVAKSLSALDTEFFSTSAPYIYRFKIDHVLGTFELVGEGCSMVMGSAVGNVETELVVRGRLAGEDDIVVLRRRPRVGRSEPTKP